MKSPLHKQSASPKGFSLIELLVSVSILSLLMLLVFQMLDRTQQIWKKSRDSIGAFKDARIAFESITRRLSQATLNTYWDYEYNGTGSSSQVNAFTRNSQLHYISGPSSQILGAPPSGAGSRVTHSLFFHAPTGYTEATDAATGHLKYGQFQDLLNAWGYFVEFNDDSKERPGFLTNLPGQGYIKPRARYRLMEFAQPSEGLQIYFRNEQDKLLDDNSTKSNEILSSWFLNSQKYGINSANNYADANAGTDDLVGRNTRLLAENVIALVILPNESQTVALRDKLSPNYYYDTRGYRSSIGVLAGNNASEKAENLFKSRNQLPPIVDVRIVAVDEGDFNRFALSNNVVDKGGFSTVDFTKGLFTSAASIDSDLDLLTDALTNAVPPIHSRVFRASVRLREAKWGGFAQ